MHLVGFIIRIHHDAPSPERQKCCSGCTWRLQVCWNMTLRGLLSVYRCLLSASRIGDRSFYRTLRYKQQTDNHITIDTAICPGALVCLLSGLWELHIWGIYWSALLTKYWSGDQIENNEIDGKCSTYGGEERCIGVMGGDLKERDNLEDPDVDGRILLRWIFRKWDWRGMNWTDLVKDRDRWRELVDAVMNLRIP